MQWAVETKYHNHFESWMERWASRLIPNDPELRHILRVRLFRILAVSTIFLGGYYYYFRYTDSLNPDALWISLPLLFAETYSAISTLLFILMLWKPKRRITPAPLPGQSVDVFIATYTEPVELVRQTAEAALKIRYPHCTYVLDDGNRPEMRAVCEEIGCDYITRDPERWGKDVPRHAKAGNVINALLGSKPDDPAQSLTSGDFILILDADQIPLPDILDETLGFFVDPQVAFVQTPQHFYNVSEDDPFGSQSPLFYGPILAGKDGWNAAFFCGSNAILRREALMQLGLATFADETEERLKQVLSQLPLEIGARKRDLSFKQRQAAEKISGAAEAAVIALRHEKPLAEVMDTFYQVVAAAQQEIISEALASVEQDLAELEILSSPDDLDDQTFTDIRQDIAQGMLRLETQNLGLNELLAQIQLKINEAFVVKPMVTYSITEDMATAMSLHSLGWKSVFYSKILAYGLAPEDLGSVLGQRFRWAAGTIQVLVNDNPLFKRGLSWPQRLQYFTTATGYFSGFASLVYLLAPVIYLFTGIAPVKSFAGEFLWRIVPYLVMNQIMYKVITWGLDVRRGEQYNMGLFPIWIQAILTVFGNQKLGFKVTPKTRQSGVYLNLVIPQLVIVILLILGCLYALFGLIVGWRHDWVGVWVNIFWAVYDIRLLSVILRAAVYNPGST